MTTALQAEEAILSRWVTAWGTTTPYAFEEEETPADVTRGETAWARLIILDRPGEQHTLGPEGSRRFLRRGQVEVQIYTPSNQGTSEALSRAQEARAVFEGVSFSGLSFIDGEMVRVGPAPPEYQVSVIVPFDYEETK